MKQRIIAAVVDVRLLTLYKEDGTTIEIPQKDPRVANIIKTIMPIVQNGGVAEVDIDEMPNTYKEFEEKSSGFVRFFKVAKTKIAGLFGNPDDEIEPDPVTGLVPTGQYGTVPVDKLTTAISSIMEQAESVTSTDYKDNNDTNFTMVAAVNNDAGQVRLIPGIEHLREQIAYASRLGSTKGIENFFKRLVPVIDQRPHSIQDLLTFLERGDLPIADDGCIVAYKILKRDDSDTTTYVDCHTRKVKQQCGSYVVVDPSLVDMSRNRECSNGLHIARRAYLAGFGGDLVTMCKIRPEDVMTVPHRDPNKVRVCGYHIIFELPNEAYRKLQNNRPATDCPVVQKMLTDALTGNHLPPQEEVRITKPMGNGVNITQLLNNNQVQQSNKALKQANKPVQVKTVDATEPKKPEAKKIRHGALDDEKSNPGIDIKAVAEEVTETRKSGSRQAIAKEMMDRARDKTATKASRRKAIDDLITYRKSLKVGWARVGYPDVTDALLISSLDGVPEDVEKAKPKVKAKAEAKPKPKVTPAVKTVSAAKGKGTVQDEARRLFELKYWDDLKAFKKLKKKSWTVLGFTPAEIEQIDG